MQELNLIPYEVKKEREKNIKFKDKISIGIIAAAVIFALVYIPYERLDSIQKKENKLKSEYSSYENAKKENDSYKKDIESLKKYIATYDSISKTKVIASEKIACLQKYITSDIAADNLTYNNKLISISAHTTNYVSISIFEANLEKSKEFTGVRVGTINYDDKNKSYSFTVTMNY